MMLQKPYKPKIAFSKGYWRVYRYNIFSTKSTNEEMNLVKKAARFAYRLNVKRYWGE